MMAVSQWSPFAKFCKNEFRLFSERQVRRKKVKCHDGSFAMVTIREIWQKWISTFFWTPSKTKESEVSWWQFRDGHHSINFAKINFNFFFTFPLFVFYFEKLISLASGYLPFNDREQQISQIFFCKKKVYISKKIA